MQKINLKDLINAGLHFGHKVTYWSPKMAPFIWGQKNKIHLIDVSKTAEHMVAAADFLRSVAAEGKTVLWIGTKKAAQKPIEEAAKKVDQPFVTHRWIGGTLTNYPQVKKSVTKLLHFEDILEKSEQFPYTKKELSRLEKSAGKLVKNIGGITHLKWPVGAIIIIDVRKENAALKEAASMGIPVVALVDTNSDPSLVDYVIPGNDDAPKSIRFIIDYLTEAVAEGREEAKVKKAAVVEAEPTEEVVEVGAILGGSEEDEGELTAEQKHQKIKKFKDAAKSKESSVKKLTEKKKAVSKIVKE